MTNAAIQSALLALALVGAALCAVTPAGAAVAGAALLALVGVEHVRTRETLRLERLAAAEEGLGKLKDTAVALIKVEARTAALERALKAALVEGQ